MYAIINVTRERVKFETENNFTGSEPLYPNGKYKPVINVLKKVKRLLKKFGVTNWETHYEEYPVCYWDHFKLVTKFVNYIIKEKGYKESEEYQDNNGNCLPEDKIKEKVFNDNELVEIWQDQFAYELNELIRKVFKVSQQVAVTCPDFGWRNVAGGKLVDLDRDNNPEQTTLNVLPDCDKNIEVYERKNSKYGHHIYMKVYHHDSPMGDSFYVYRKKYLSGVDKKHLG
jgi:hypothetical protein